MQDIIVTFIVIVTLGYVGLKIYKSMTTKPDSTERCSGCTGCNFNKETGCRTNC